MDSVQIYKGDPTLTQPRAPLANWTSVHLENNPNRPMIDEVTRGELQWNMFSNNNMDYRSGQGQRNEDHNNRPSDEMKSIQGDPIYLDDDGSTSEPGLEEVG